MSISCQNLGKGFSGFSLFSGLNLSISEKSKLGIIGPNGSGKSTLLRILAGVEEPDEGKVFRSKNLRVIYLAQDAAFPGDQTLSDTVLKANGWSKDNLYLAAASLSRLGFLDPEQKVSSLSGGWTKRLAIAIALSTEPDVILFDEPTNHLDLGGIECLEGILAKADFAWVMISHDRYFLNQTVKDILAIDPRFPGAHFTYAGNYDDFVDASYNFLKSQEERAQSLKQKLKTETAWLNTMPKARSTKAQYRIDAALALKDEVSELRKRNDSAKSTELSFSSAERKTKKLVEAKGISYSYGDRKILQNFDFTLVNQSRIALLGGNGVGKTTLLKLFGKMLEPMAGAVNWADKLSVVYFDQKREELDGKMTLKRALAPDSDSVVFGDRVIHVASWARRFGFTNDQLEVKIANLSGGEKARVLLARLMVKKADVLLLDEPTNDLDIESLEALEESLLEFNGAVVIISHDRYLVSKVCDTFVGFLPGGRIEAFADLEQWQKAQNVKTVIKEPQVSVAPTAKMPARGKKEKLSFKEQRELDGMEAQILAAEAKLEGLKQQCEDPKNLTDSTAANALFVELNQTQTDIDRMYQRWEDLSARSAP